jgi:hypothetical protein
MTLIDIGEVILIDEFDMIDDFRHKSRKPINLNDLARPQRLIQTFSPGNLVNKKILRSYSSFISVEYS